MHPDHLLNLASWEELAALHGQDAYYDSEGLISGHSSLIEEEESALQLAGIHLPELSVLHVQCHLGFDSIEFARRGARVTGVDFSAVALEKAESLAVRSGAHVEWIRADATDLPSCLDGRFDLAWATIGVLCWIADLPRWMGCVSRSLAPGGRLVLMDAHPLRRILKTEPVRIARPYGGSRIPISDGCDYATRTRTGAQVQFLHSLGEIVSAAAGAGLRVTHLIEHTDLSCDICDDGIKLEPDGRYRRRADGHALPVLFTLIAGKDATGPSPVETTAAAST